MKKLIFSSIFVILGLLSGLLWAQPVVSYTFSSTQGTYTPISDGTLVFSGSTPGAVSKTAFNGLTFNNSSIGSAEKIKDIGYPIGFDFTYCGIAMNRFAINSNGNIALGKDSVYTKSSWGSFGASYPEPYFSYIMGSMPNKDAFAFPITSLLYKTSGSSPNRVFTVEFRNLGYQLGWSDGTEDTVNFQIKLYESSNKIEFVFGNYTNEIPNDAYISCGIKGASEMDVHLRGGQFAKSIQTTATGELKWTKTLFPVSGLTYTFMQPPTCVAPTVAPSNLVLKQTSTDLKATFKPSTDADYYLVVQSLEATPSKQPVNGKIYAEGDTIGNGIVLTWFQDTTFFVENLIPSTTYYYHVYPASYLCSGSFPYSTDKVLSGSVKMWPKAPSSLHIDAMNFDSLVISGTTNATNTNMLVLMTDKPLLSDYGDVQMCGNFGLPTVNLNVGDTTNTGALVIYKGGNFSQKSIKNFNTNTIYHFAAFSLNETDGTCSSLFAQADTLTDGIVPWYSNLSAIPSFEEPYGWSLTGPISPRIGRDNIFEWNANRNKKAIVNTMTTLSWIKMNGTFENRLLFTYNITSFAGYMKKPYNDWGTDSLEFQYTENGIDYTTFFTINQQNRDSLANAQTFASKRIPMNGVKGKTIKLRLQWKTSDGPILTFNALEIEELRPCDYPLHVCVIDSTIEGSNALVKWDALNGENLWNIRYRSMNSLLWSDPIAADNNPYMVSSFTPNSLLEVQVQAKCTQEDLSLWSKTSNSFQSGYVVPFVEKFNDSDLPLYWGNKKGAFTSSTLVKDLETAKYDGWSFDFKTDPKKHSMNTGLNGSPEYPIQAWFLSPKISLGTGNVHYQLEFDASLTKTASIYQAPDSIKKAISFSVAISTDGGNSFQRSNILKIYDSTNNSLLKLGDSTHVILDLSPYKGEIQIGFFASSSVKETAYLWLDNIGFQPTCQSPSKLAITSVAADKATLAFENNSNANEWIVGIRKVGENAYTYTTLTTKEHTFLNLIQKTDYEICLTNICSAADTAQWMHLVFTSLSLEPCNMPTALNAKNITKNSATIAWTGGATNYKVQFKSASATTWIQETVNTNEFAIAALLPATSYQYKVQAVCSQAIGDTSTWTEIASFTTAEISCIAPTELTASLVKHNSAKLSWTGKGSNYQVAYQLGETGTWTLLVANAKELTMTGLSPLKTYNTRVREICGADDTSNWSATINFTTLAIPICDAPTNLSVSNISTTSAKLAWEATVSNASWLVRYRAASVLAWDSAKNISVKTYTLEHLSPNTAYLWSVQGLCEEGRISAWGNQANFSTEKIAIENDANSGLHIYTDKGQIHLLNIDGLFIDRIELYNTMGQRLQEYNIRSNENVLINTNLSAQPVIIRVYEKNKICNFKLLIK